MASTVCVKFLLGWARGEKGDGSVGEKVAPMGAKVVMKTQCRAPFSARS
jgi:hypothetical protein